MPRRTLLSLSIVTLLAGCGHAAPPKSEPGTSSTPPPPAASATESKPSEAEPEAKGPAAKIIELTPSNESTPFLRMKLRFSNPTTSPCTFRAYTLVWSGGKKRVEGKNFVVPPGSERQRTLRVDGNDGNISTLDPKTAWIDLETDCSGK